MVTIENNFLKFSCKEQGAELTSIFSKQTQLEYLWQAGNEWNKHAPVLFPIVGQLKNNTYIWQNKEYKLDRHGFARTMKFEVGNLQNESVEFILKSNADTLTVFPFEFVLRIIYKLINDALVVEYTVENKNKSEMHFSIGAHPAFKVPLLDNENYGDHYLEFSEKEIAPRWLLQNGLIAEPEIFFSDSTILPLAKKLFYDDALVFKNLKSETISIKNKKTNHGLHFHCKGFPYFGIWAAKDADFICLEPWHGIADNVNHNQQLNEKEGIIKLQSGENFACHYAIQPFAGK